jgi:predicted transcriptional regulator
MKTAVSIPDDLFADADRLASELRLSRSRLYADALAEYVARHSSETVTETLDAVYGEGSAAPDSFADAAARLALRDPEW